MKNIVRIVVFALFPLVLSAPVTAFADPITYNLTLTPNEGSLYGGTGTFMIESAPSSTGLSEYSIFNGGLDNLSFVIDGQTFSLDHLLGNAFIVFQNGELYDLTFSEQIGASSNRFSLHTTSNYAFYYNNGQSVSYGTITAQPTVPIPSDPPAVSSVPEPKPFDLLGTGLLGGGLLLFRARFFH